jgi:RNA polymerase sigma-70 factor (ECF subfamily)
MLFPGEPDFLIKFRAGDASALERVYCAYVDHVSRVVEAIRRSRTRAAPIDHDDLVQEVFAKAFAPRARRRFEGGRPFRPYLAQIARNVVADHWRRRRGEVALDPEPLLERLSIEADDGRTKAERAAYGQTMSAIDRYLASIPADVRRVHHALYVEGMSQREAAAALGVGRQAVRGLDARLRDGLRRELRRARRQRAASPRLAAGHDVG